MYTYMCVPLRVQLSGRAQAKARHEKHVCVSEQVCSPWYESVCQGQSVGLPRLVLCTLWFSLTLS